jgi:hypothetical protein
MAAEYFQNPKTSWKGSRTLDQYAAYLTQFVRQTYTPARATYAAAIDADGNVDNATLEKLQPALDEFRNIAGNQMLAWSDFIGANILTNRPAAHATGGYDLRMIADDYEPDWFDDTILGNGVQDLLPAFLNYYSNGVATVKDRDGKDVSRDVDYTVYDRIINGEQGLGGVADLTAALAADPNLKIMALHGYYDDSTPFYKTQTQLQLAGLDRVIPLHLFASGHMEYYVESERKHLKKVFDEYYAAVPAMPATN